MGIEVPIHLKSIEDYIIAKHGEWRQLTLPERRILDRYGRKIVARVQDEWPVDTSLSRDNFEVTIQAFKRPLMILIENDVFYAQYVHRAGTDPDDALWRSLIPRIIAEVSADLLYELRAEIDRTEADLLRGLLPAGPGLLRASYAPGARA